jgi:hypothetical protein
MVSEEVHTVQLAEVDPPVERLVQIQEVVVLLQIAAAKSEVPNRKDECRLSRLK